MSMDDNKELFEGSQMRSRYETVYEFLAAEGAQCGLYKNYIIQALHHVGEALHFDACSEDLWKAYVLLDVLVDRWEECMAIVLEENKELVDDITG